MANQIRISPEITVLGNFLFNRPSPEQLEVAEGTIKLAVTRNSAVHLDQKIAAAALERAGWASVKFRNRNTNNICTFWYKAGK